MKKIIFSVFTVICFSASGLAISPDTSRVLDTVIMKDVRTGEKRKEKIVLPGANRENISIETTKTVIKSDGGKTNDPSNTVKNRRNEARPFFGITFSRIDLGLTRPMNGGSFAMDGDNEILSYRSAKTMNFGFDIVQVGYRFNQQFRLFLSGGFDWTYIRLKQGLDFDPNRSPYESADAFTDDFSKNRLTSTYLRLPLTFEIRSRENNTRLAFGPIAGILLTGTQRYKLDDGNITTSIKRRGGFGFAPFQYGAFARIGYKQVGLFGKYYFNDMFENSPSGAGLQNFTFGLTVGF